MVNERILQVNFRVKKYHFFAPLTFFPFPWLFCIYQHTATQWTLLFEMQFWRTILIKVHITYYDNLPGFLMISNSRYLKNFKTLVKWYNFTPFGRNRSIVLSVTKTHNWIKTVFPTFLKSPHEVRFFWMSTSY